MKAEFFSNYCEYILFLCSFNQHNIIKNIKKQEITPQSKLDYSLFFIQGCWFIIFLFKAVSQFLYSRCIIVLYSSCIINFEFKEILRHFAQTQDDSPLRPSERQRRISLNNNLTIKAQRSTIINQLPYSPLPLASSL